MVILIYMFQSFYILFKSIYTYRCDFTDRTRHLSFKCLGNVNISSIIQFIDLNALNYQR